MRAASTDEAAGVLTGVLLAAEDDGVRLVATDSYRLAVRDLPETGMLAAGQKVLVPHRALTELQRILGASEELTVRLGDRDATFECGHDPAHDPADRGRVPELPPPDPVDAPEPVSPSARRRCSTRCGG